MSYLVFEIISTYFYPKPYINTPSLVKYRGKSENVIFEIVLTYFYLKPYTNTSSLVKYRGKSKNLDFRDSCNVLLPEAVYEYGEFGRMRRKYSKM